MKRFANARNISRATLFDGYDFVYVTFRSVFFPRFPRRTRTLRDDRREFLEDRVSSQSRFTILDTTTTTHQLTRRLTVVKIL